MKITPQNIRPALPEDAPQAARLIIETGHETNRIAFGSLENAHKILTDMFVRPRNVHSHDLSTVYSINGKVVGILIGYTSEQERRTKLPSASFLFFKLGFKMGGILRIQGMIGNVDSRDYYVHVLAVDPELRSHGIGALLMNRAEHQAFETGKTRISLLVEALNKRAINFYLREGYVIVEPRQDKILMKRYNFPGYIKMVKDIS